MTIREGEAQEGEEDGEEREGELPGVSTSVHVGRGGGYNVVR